MCDRSIPFRVGVGSPVVIFVRPLSAGEGRELRRPTRTGATPCARVAMLALCAAFVTGVQFSWVMPTAAASAGGRSATYVNAENDDDKDSNDDGGKGKKEKKRAKKKDRKKSNRRGDDAQEQRTAGETDGEDERGRPGKVGVCHATGSASNPYRYVQISERAVPAHEKHGDIVGVESADACPTAAGSACPPRDAGDASAAKGAAEEATPGPTEDPAGDTVDDSTAAATTAGDVTGDAGAARGRCPPGGSGRGAQDDAAQTEVGGADEAKEAEGAGETDNATTTGELQLG